MGACSNRLRAMMLDHWLFKIVAGKVLALVTRITLLRIEINVGYRPKSKDTYGGVFLESMLLTDSLTGWQTRDERSLLRVRMW